MGHRTYLMPAQRTSSLQALQHLIPRSPSSVPGPLLQAALESPHERWGQRQQAHEPEDGQEILVHIRYRVSQPIAEAITLTQDFAVLVRQRHPDQLEAWLERATA